MSPSPFEFGVSGHIKLHPDDQRIVREAVRSVLETIRTRTGDRPLRLLSSLAEGADRLVTHEALDLEPELVVVLPMAGEEYEKDFTTFESRQEFQHLLSCSDQVIRADEGAPHDLPSRYTASDLRIAASGNLLVALWDGIPASKDAGTAWVVGQRLDDPAAETAGPVVHILCRRDGQASLDSPGAIRWLLPGWIRSDPDHVIGL